MNQILRSAFLVTFCLSCLTVLGQLPPNQPEQDCINALSICQDVYFQPNSYAGGGRDPDEINASTSCLLLGERNSVWYVFTVQTQGQLCFTISPADTLDDYDWALYDLTNASCSQIPTTASLEVACSWTYNNGCQGQTGANGNMANCAGQSTPCISVTPGQTFALSVNNFTASNAGYTIDFSQSSARLYDDIPPKLSGMESFCTGVRVSFDENILCGSVDPTDFTFSGPNGPYTISQVTSENCDLGGAFDRTFDLIVSPPIQQTGNYTLSLVGSVVDNCGNSAELKTETVWMPLPPTASFNSPTPQCLLGNSFAFNYTGSSQVVDYFWDFGDSIGATVATPMHSYITPGAKDVLLVILDVNGCSDTAENQVEVLPKPNARYIAPLTACQWDSINFQNETTFPGAEQSAMFWDLGDGNTTSDESPSHAFVEYGAYRVYLEAENTLGCKDTFSQTIIVNPKPEVDFIVEDNVCWGDTAELFFLATIEQRDRDYIESWTWDFGDSTFVDSMINPKHLYSAPGTYPVILSVISDKDCRANLQKDQIIHHPPPPIVQGDTVCIGDYAVVEVTTVESGIARWFYEMNDSSAFSNLYTLTTEEPVVFPYQLYVDQVSPEGCLSDRVPVDIALFDLGEGQIVVSDSSIEFPNPMIDFSFDGTITAEQYEWNLGDGRMSSEPSFSHLYAYSSVFDVELNLIDIHGCEYDFKTSVEVKNPVAIHVPSAFTPNGDGSNDVLFVGHHLLQSFQFSLYSRTGNRVYTTDNPDFRWNGRTASGKAVMEGVYVYHLTGIDLTGQKIHNQGTISVIR